MASRYEKRLLEPIEVPLDIGGDQVIIHQPDSDGDIKLELVDEHGEGAGPMRIHVYMSEAEARRISTLIGMQADLVREMK